MRWELKNFRVLGAITLVLFVIGIAVAVFKNGTPIQEIPDSLTTIVVPKQSHSVDPVI